MPRGVERLRLQIVDFDEEIDRLKAKVGLFSK